MDLDDICLGNFDKLKADWVKLCSTSSAGICELASRYRQRDDCYLRSMHSGSFNFSLRLHWDDEDEDWLIRFPLPGKSMVLDEKIAQEASIMRYISEHTSIPIPRVIAHGTSEENPTGLGPFIIMNWIEGTKMSDILKKDGMPVKQEVLDPDLDPQILRNLYSQMADVLLELWSLEFDSIGTLGQSSGEVAIMQGPQTLEMNELMRTSGISKDAFTSDVYHSSTDYIASLLHLQSLQLEEQRNSIYDTVDCREKYTCRHLMKSLALNFIHESDNHGPFRLFCDDMGPGNVLVNDSLQITGVIDWEFCYAAPSQFASGIPWWLLLRQPESIVNQKGADGFLAEFLPKAEIFLQALEEKEQARGITPLSDPGHLSTRMRNSIEDKSAWFILACRKVSSVDLIYWELLDEFCFGPRVSIPDRICHTTSGIEMHKNREEFVRRKIHQLQEYYDELGEDIQVKYGEDKCQQESKPVEELCPRKNTSSLVMIGTLGILLSVAGVVKLTQWARR
ncbi:uncharacterized protein N7459_008003 [Penicillium hispanicum]|uniref:uncharacterized protein n=1 Tax=Penicillium hispanicum TaxID=1080232 RepID=UPI002540EE18|nr:uncharacterized protein N7459_008003 [Penicillium hispanicum]KAJ5573576.1 hypothetical protein N7459_008003 [Penicillium hispanicum]